MMDLNRYLYDSKTKWGGIFWDRELEKRFNDERYLEQYGYKVYSQNDEDGIIHEIFCRIETTTKFFVEFGVDIGLESNCHSLLLQGWSGLWIEGRQGAYEQILRRFAPAIRDGRLNVLNEYVSVGNINPILDQYVPDELDLLSIDVDGNDWHIWNAIEVVNPRVVIIEYNGKLPPEIDWRMPYNEYHVWDGTDRQGASLKSLENLGRKKGYELVGTNICGINAFFVRGDLVKDKFATPYTAENFYNPARMNMLRFANGHKPRNFLGSETEGIEGVFEYYPDWNCIATFGFYKVIFRNGEKRFLMCEKRGRLFLRFVPEDADSIIIRYRIPLGEMSDSVEVNVTIDMTKSVSVKLQADYGIISLDIGQMNLQGRTFPVDIITNKMWQIAVPELSPGKVEAGIEIVGVSYE